MLARVRTQLLIRNAVCLATAVSPDAFDVAAFAESLGLGAGQEKLRLPNASITEWEKARLQVMPEKLQLGFKPEADEGEFVRRVLAAFLTRVDELVSGKFSVGFNAVLLVTPEEGDGDPSKGLFDAGALAEALGGTGGRGGVTLVFHDALSRWWVELSPQPEEEGLWSYDFNRQFDGFPPVGDERDGVLDWFADVEGDLHRQFETISGRR